MEWDAVLSPLYCKNVTLSILSLQFFIKLHMFYSSDSSMCCYNWKIAMSYISECNTDIIFSYFVEILRKFLTVNKILKWIRQRISEARMFLFHYFYILLSLTRCYYARKIEITYSITWLRISDLPLFIANIPLN